VPATVCLALAGAFRFRRSPRKTDKGLPQYLEPKELDVFILSGSEDLVPVFAKKRDGTWDLDDQGNFFVHRRGPGRPGIMHDIPELIVRMAQDNLK
jgi:hypothetical protein